MPHPESPVTDETLERLPFLQAIIKESLRIGYGLPGPLPRDTPPEGAEFCGVKIPGGFAAAHSHYMYHGNPDVFPDPFSWKPERWLVSDTREMEKHFMPFSRGARMCIGMNLANAELTTTIARLFRRFDFKYAEGFKDENMEWWDFYLPVTKGKLTVQAVERSI